MRAFLIDADTYRDDLLKIGPDTPPEPRWNQDWFPRLDALAAYAMVRRLCPNRIVEIGAGHSTRFMARALRDGGQDANFISIDPHPRAVLDGLAGHELWRDQLQNVPRAWFDALSADDILFVDSSHVRAPGSDVDRLITEILPRLPIGIMVHFHDIFLPADYPAAWAGRRYNEQTAVADLITSGHWSIEFSSAFAVCALADSIAQSVAIALPLVEGAIESSLWLRKTAAP